MMGKNDREKIACFLCVCVVFSGFGPKQMLIFVLHLWEVDPGK